MTSPTRVPAETLPATVRRPALSCDCYAARLASALARRFGTRSTSLARTRLEQAVARGNVVKADLYLAVNVVLRDESRIFSRSRV